MRISDWSSDVCSSDLVGADGCVFTHGLLPRLNRRHLSAVFGYSHHLDRLFGAHGAIADARALRHFPEAAPSGRSAQKRLVHGRSEEHTSELQSLMRLSYAFFCLTKTKIFLIYNLHDPCVFLHAVSYSFLLFIIFLS